MNENKMHPLTKKQSDFAAEHYGLVFSFLKRKRLDADEYHDVVIFSYLQAVQVYDEHPEFCEGSFPSIADQAMHRALRFHLQKLNRKGVRGAAAEISRALCEACDLCIV